MPDMTLTVVDLPAPLGPMYPTSSPASTSKEIPVEGVDGAVTTMGESAESAPNAGVALGDAKSLDEVVHYDLGQGGTPATD